MGLKSMNRFRILEFHTHETTIHEKSEAGGISMRPFAGVQGNLQILPLFVLLILLLPTNGLAQFSPSEIRGRRQAALSKVPDGILLLHSLDGLKHWEEPGFHQDANFYYFTG